MSSIPLGLLIRAKREALGLTQEELALKTQISQQSIAKYESDQAAPRPGNIKRLAEALGLDALEFAKAKVGSNSALHKINEARNSLVENVTASSTSSDGEITSFQRRQQLILQLKREIKDHLEVKHAAGEHDVPIDVGRYTHKASYISESVLALYVFFTEKHPRYTEKLATAAWRLLVLRSGLGREYNGVSWLIGVMPEFEAPDDDDDIFPTTIWAEDSVQRFQNEASFVGIETNILSTPAEVAELICGVERNAKIQETDDDLPF
jgi:transcriptional regulator with XRE-family HTH domain